MSRMGNKVQKIDHKVLKDVVVPCALNLLPFENLAELEHGLRHIERTRWTRLRPYMANPNDDLVFYHQGTRETMLDWVSAVHYRLELTDLALHRAVHYADKFLSLRGAEPFLQTGADAMNALPLGTLSERSVLYLERHDTLPSTLRTLMITCLFIAAKIEEGPQDARSFARASGVRSFTKPRLLDFEVDVLVEMDHILHQPTTICFASVYLHDLKDCRPLESGRRAEPLAPPLALEYERLVSLLLETVALAQDSLDFMPSTLAASAVAFVGTRVFDVPLPVMAVKFQSAAHSSEDLERGYALFDKVVNDLRRSARLAKPLTAAHKYATGLHDLGRFTSTDLTC